VVGAATFGRHRWAPIPAWCAPSSTPGCPARQARIGPGRVLPSATGRQRQGRL